MITSTSNSQVKQVSAIAKKAKARRESGLFIVEGEKMFSELPKERLHRTYVTESFLRQQGEEADRLLAGCRYETVTGEVMKAMADTQTPQGILALCRQFSYELSDILGERKEGDEYTQEKAPAQLVILETLQDPGNLGTILRAGEGAGITGVIMNSTTADIYNPKVIRSTMGSVYRVPFVYVEDLAGAVRRVKQAGVRLYAAHLKGEKNYDQQDYTGSTGFLIGNEANGLSDETAELADAYIKIPMLGKVESLNAAVAASILMYETARQRRNGKGQKID